VKFGSSEGDSKGKIMRIDFTGQSLSRTDTVKRYIQALIVRDEDYAKSLMKNPPELLTLSNPHQSGYNILSEGKDEAGNYVEAEVYWQYTATPYYSIEKSRYYLSEGEKGYVIDSIKPLGTTEVYFKNGTMYLKNDNSEKVLFSEEGIPSEYYTKGGSYIQSAALNEKNNSLIFTLYNDQNGAGSVMIVQYDMTAGEFKLIDRLSTIGNERIMGSTDISLNSTGRYAAVNLYYGKNENIKNTIAAYNLDNNQRVNIGEFIKGDFESMYVSFWDDNRLVLTGVKSNQVIKYKYDSENNLLINF
jgi:hypothetical protein